MYTSVHMNTLICVCMYKYVCAHNAHMQKSACTYLCLFTRMYICVYIQSHVYIGK